MCSIHLEGHWINSWVTSWVKGPDIHLSDLALMSSPGRILTTETKLLWIQLDGHVEACDDQIRDRCSRHEILYVRQFGLAWQSPGEGIF